MSVFDPYAPLTGRTLNTQLFSGPLEEPPGCGPGRQESELRMYANGKMYNFVFRDKIIPDDVYIVLLKATAFSIARTEEYRGVPPSRAVRDYLIKSNISI